MAALNNAIDREAKAGNREAVIEALTLKAASLAPRTHGAGSDSPEDPFETQGDWGTHDLSGPMNLKEHSDGDGAIGKQSLTEEQRILGQFKIKESEHRTRDLEKLTTSIKKHPNGVIDYPWGSIFPDRKEVKVGDKITISKAPNKIYFRNCPSCGRQNKPDAGVCGHCIHCQFNVIDSLVRPCIDRFKKDFPDMWLD